MPLFFVQNDITAMRADAVVNAANETLLGGGGVDGAIHRAAGPGLLKECRALGGCKTGRAKITAGHRLPAKYVIHAVGPVWRGGGFGERELLASAYRSSLELALAHGCGTVAFPLISSGAYGYPKDQALKVAADVIGGFLLTHEMTVWLVFFDRTFCEIGEKLFADIAARIDGRFAAEDGAARRALTPAFAPKTSAVRSESLNGVPDRPDESFSRMLLRKIGERGMTDAECCAKANVCRSLLSEIRSDSRFRPAKSVAAAFAAALELPPEEAREMMEKAGFAFSRADGFDVIVEYFIARCRYNVIEINEALFVFGQSLLGG